MNSNDLVTIIQNSPMKVNFAGLTGDTMQMQRFGWEIAAQTDEDFYTRRLGVRLTGRHRGLNLHFYSAPIMLDRGMIHKDLQQGFVDFGRYAMSPILIEHCTQHIMIPIMGDVSIRFNAVDFSEPVMSKVSRKNLSLSDLVPFRSFNEDAQIFVPDNKIMTAMDALSFILEEQKPFQAELREKQRKKQFRDGREVDLMCNPHKDVKLQLVGV